MLRLFTKNNGAVTVFLVLIMVPVITVATVFVDASRLRMAESIVNSSADLTLETVMAKYDAELSDYYGLLASAQDAEDMVNKANEYLVSAMTSQGLSADQATSLLSAAVDRFSTDDIVDMLQLSLAGGEDGGEGEGGGTASVVSPVENGDLTNAAIVKKQISEFMKYRAPINLAAGIIEKFTNFKHRMDLAKEETDLMEKKQTFYETENKLLEEAYNVYKLTLDYQAHFGGDIKKYIEDMKTALNNLEDRYFHLHTLLVMDLYNSDGVKPFTLPGLNTYQDSGKYDDDHQASKNNIKSLASDLSSACSDFRDAITNLENAGLTQHEAAMYNVQYWVKVMREDLGNNNTNNVFTKYAAAANKMVSKWAELKSALNHKKEDVDLDGIDLGCLDTAQELYSKYIENSKNTYYYKVGHIMQEGSEQTKRSRAELDGELRLIKSQMQGYYNTMQNAKATADKIVSGCTKVISLAEDYQRDYTTWQNAAEAGKSAMAEEDRKAEDDELVASLRQQVSDEKVVAMQTRYKNISTLLDNIRGDIDKYVYGKKKVREIGEFKHMKNAFVADKESITAMEEYPLSQYAEHSFIFTYSVPDPAYIDTIDESNNPDTINSPEEFERWLRENFHIDQDDNKKDGDAKRDKIKESGEDKADDENTSVAEHVSDKEIKDQPELPSKGGANTQKEEGSAIGKASSSISKIVENFTLDNNLERFYALDYVMSMFTYDTYLYEGLYNNKDDLEFSEEVDTIEQAKKLHAQTYVDKWNAKADEPTFTDDKTLTNKVRSMENQFSFGNEVEYILYGGSNSENKTCAYGLIYLIRYAMNTAPMFAAGWHSELIDTIANTISGLTQGIVPAALIKTLIILALIAFESAYDLALLQQGLPVLFVKTKDDLYIDPDLNLDGDGLVKDTNETLATTKESNPGEGEGFDDVIQDLNQFFYSDYLTLFLFISLTANEEKTYSRIADVIQVNMAKNTGNDGYRLSKSQVYYKIDANVEMPAFMMKLPINQDASVWEQMQSSKYQIQYSEIRGY